MITIEEKRENFRRWWKKYIKIYSKEFILEHLEGIAETIFNSVLNCDIKIFDIDPWHYPSKKEYPTEKNKQYLCKVKDCRKVWYEVADWDDFWLLDKFNQVVAWQCIDPPKEKENG